MHRMVLPRSIPVALATLAIIFVIGAPGAEAQLGGTAPLVQTTTMLSTTGPLPAGTSGAAQAADLTGSIPGLLAAEVLRGVTIGWEDEHVSEASLAALELNVAGIKIGADFVMARARAVFGVAGTALSTVDSLSIDGVPVLVTGDPNQMIGLPGGVLIINEQQVAADGTSTVVNALHVMVSGVADIVIASAAATITAGQASAVVATY